MKKKISLSIFIISSLIFVFLWHYDKSASYNYDISHFFEYLFYWSIAVFILSLFAFVLHDKKYKIWLGITMSFMFLSIFFSYYVGIHDPLFSGDYVNFWLIGLYTISALIYFIVQFVKNKKQSNLL